MSQHDVISSCDVTAWCHVIMWCHSMASCHHVMSQHDFNWMRCMNAGTFSLQNMNGDISSIKQQKEREESIKLAKTLFLIFIVFVACWGPYITLIVSILQDMLYQWSMPINTDQCWIKFMALIGIDRHWSLIQHVLQYTYYKSDIRSPAGDEHYKYQE